VLSGQRDGHRLGDRGVEGGEDELLGLGRVAERLREHRGVDQRQVEVEDHPAKGHRRA
jgi:hypothetical protein